MDRKKELKELYKTMKPDMGVFIIRSNSDDKYFIQATPNLKGKINSVKFQLEGGVFVNRELQREWKEKGESAFTIEILEKLEYDKDESKTDYSEELELLKMIWEERLANKGMKAYGK
ncbi:MAG TPA: GIY-YIG nuclease family protein [Acetivibrio sp.]|nr:GIY-YIG nuclease family protein [Acetivibrio sp.]